VLPRYLQRTIAYLADDAGVAGLLIAMLLMIVSFSALTIFLNKYTGPGVELARLQAAARHQTILKASLLAHFNSQDDGMPCPDADQDGTADACSGDATTSGTLPWLTLGMSRDDVIDAYGTYYTYVVADASQNLCVSVANDYDDAADPEYTGETLPFEDLQVVATTAGATGTYVPFALISHGKNRLGGISSEGTPRGSPPAGSFELANATENPTTIYTGPANSDDEDYFDDIIWSPATSDLASVCEQRTPGGALNSDLVASFEGADGDVDQDKFETDNAGTEVQQENGEAVFADATTYMTTAGANLFNSSERALYISADWTPDADAANGGFSIVTRAEATPTGGIFDPGITFQFFDGTGAAGPNTITILNDGAPVTGLVSLDDTFTMSFGETYLLEVYDNGDDVWMQITQKNMTTNRAMAYAPDITADTTGTRVAFVNGTASESRLDNLTVGVPMMALDTRGTGYVETTGNTNGPTNGSITVEGWFRPRLLPVGNATATLISQWDSATASSTGSYRLYMDAAGALSLSLSRAAVTDTESLGASIAAEEWTHVAVAYDDDNATYGEITVYINGELVNTITGTVGAQILGGGAIRDAAEHFVVGANLNGIAGENIFDGLVSDVRVWSDVRTAEEIETWYDHRLPLVNSGSDTIHTGLRVNWRFDIESGGFASTQAMDYPTSIGSPGDLQPTATPANMPTWAGALLFTHRTTSTDICNGFRVGAFRCDFRDTVSSMTITGQNLGALPTFYAKAWGGGGGADTAGGASAPYDGGGGGYAGGLFVNTGGNLTITVGTGGASGTIGVNGGDSFLDQGAQRVTGNNGVRGQDNNPGNNGLGAVSGSLLTSSIDPTTSTNNRRPGCVPAITVVGNPCTDEHYTTTGAPVAEPGYGADGALADYATGQVGAVVLFW